MDYFEPNARQMERDLADLRRRMLRALGFMGGVTAIGAVGFSIIDPTSGLVRALFMTVITLTTVGYGEEIPIETDGARVFTAALILVGMGVVLYFVSTGTAFLLEGHLGNVFRRRQMERALDQTRDHFIVCGAGSTALYAAAELVAVRRTVVLVTPDRSGAERARAALPDVQIVVGDPTEDAILRAAGVTRATGLVAATESDNQNVVVTLTARQLNHELRIATRVQDVEHMQKVRKAGADATVSPQHIGGLRLASELVRPTVVDFLDTMLRDRELNLRVDEATVPSDSDLVGEPVGALRLEELPKALLLAVRIGDAWEYNPPRTRRLEGGMVLVLLGTPEDAEGVRTRLGGGGGSGEAPR